MRLQAHRGVQTECPENTMPAFLSAIEQGYDSIELDVRVTKDLVCILLHDETINRTARNKDGSVIEKDVFIADLTYEETLQYDFGSWFSAKFAGTPAPLLADVLELARKHGVQLKIDAKYYTMSDEHKAALFQLIKPYQDVAALTCKTLEAIAEARAEFPDMQLHFGGAVTKENMEAVSQIVPKDYLTLWLPYTNKQTSYVTVPYVTVKKANLAKEYGNLGVWNLCEYHELWEMEQLPVDIIETNGQIKPVKNQGVLADMHTHSRNSHDAKPPVMDLCQGAMANGVSIMAVADHCDVALLEHDPNKDIYTNLVDSYKEATEVNEQLGDSFTVLPSIELGEGCWFPEECNKVLNLVPYDSIVAAIHAVKDKTMESLQGTHRYYAGLNYATMTQEQLYAIADTYLDDLLHMADTLNFDILAHLTCVVGYTLGRHDNYTPMFRFEDKIRKILAKIIQRGIALEVNCGGYNRHGQVSPYVWIIKMYREMGGYLVTLGSDAHSGPAGGSGCKKAAQMLKQLGFHNIFYLKNRRFIQCTL